jgi:hypothetical protein
MEERTNIMNKNTMGVDSHGARVLHFRSEARNLSRLSLLLDLIMEMFESGDWRNYSTALGRERWRACEFDYFLIASDIKYADASQVFTWRDRGRALAAATQSKDPRHRRSLAQASKEWHAPTPETLEQRAERLGWTSARGVRSPAPKRARAYVRHGMTYEAHARQQRQRQIKDRRVVLDRIVDAVLRQVSDDTALRYVVERLRERLAKQRQHNDTQWARDIATFKGNEKALAQHWGITLSAVKKRKKVYRSTSGILKAKAS